MKILLKKFHSITKFPSLTITKNLLIPSGTFAKLQNEFFSPDIKLVSQLDDLLHKNDISILAHYYMDPELQSIISKCKYKNISISDSLQMGTKAIDHIRNGAKHIAVLGVDFMTENVKGILSSEGYSNIPVYRLSSKKIGCSLAESADKNEYQVYLHNAMKKNNPFHIMYINTSLITKGLSNKMVRTITCTSSNVLKLILETAKQSPGSNIFFGPDTYMGQNLHDMLLFLKENPNELEKISENYPLEILNNLLKNFHFFRQGICIVHHMFDDRITEIVNKNYKDSYITAHLEVPSGMFKLALEAKKIDRGVVGSTSDILNYIIKKTKENIHHDKVVSFVLGTESGMITSIKCMVEKILLENNSNLKVEIIFPVSEASMNIMENEQTGEKNVLPGAKSGEGCSISGSCATCPYMKMNDIDSLIKICEMIDSGKNELSKYVYSLPTDKIDTLKQGLKTIVDMQFFQKNGYLNI